MTTEKRKQAAHGHADNIEAAIRSADTERFKTAVVDWLADVATEKDKKRLTLGWKAQEKGTLESTA